MNSIRLLNEKLISFLRIFRLRLSCSPPGRFEISYWRPVATGYFINNNYIFSFVSNGRVYTPRIENCTRVCHLSDGRDIMLETRRTRDTRKEKK